MTIKGLEEVSYILTKSYDLLDQRVRNMLSNDSKHGKTKAQKAKATAKRHKKNKNKKTHRK